MTVRKFQEVIRAWYRHHGRHDLPWRKTRDPYRILVSEVMLQQTQVSRVLRYYPRFLKAFPNLTALAQAPLARVLRFWQGMGYNRRALYLKRLTRIIIAKHVGRMPRDPAALRELPGVGPATAGAIAAFAFGKRVAFLETNIRRVYLHFFFPHRRRVADREIIREIRRTMPGHDPRQWYYALMDYGALALKGVENPNRRSAAYRRQPRLSGSRRELRGKILAAILARRTVAPAVLRRQLPSRHWAEALRDLRRDGLVRLRNRRRSVIKVIESY